MYDAWKWYESNCFIILWDFPLNKQKSYSECYYGSRSPVWLAVHLTHIWTHTPLITIRQACTRKGARAGTNTLQTHYWLQTAFPWCTHAQTTASTLAAPLCSGARYIKLINALTAINNSGSPPSTSSWDAATGDGTAEDRSRSGPPPSAARALPPPHQ